MALNGTRVVLACVALACASVARAQDGRTDFQRGVEADLGSKGRPDPVLAYRYYERAASVGDAEAELNLGVMNDSGVGTPADTAAAALWYARAAAHGDARAAYDLGQLYEAGDGVPRNRTLAAAWFRQAASEGIEAASARARLLSAQTAPADGLPAPVLVAPAGAAVAEGDVELVWQSAATAPGMRYWVQVVDVGAGGAQTLAYRDTDVSAMLVHVPGDDRDYAWRVFAAGAAHYRASAWSHFSVHRGVICCLASLSGR